MVVSRSSRSATATAANSGTAERFEYKGPTVPLDPEQRSRLIIAKARTLVADHLGDLSAPDSELIVGSFPGGATVRAGTRGWVLLDAGAERGFGAALAWSQREELESLDVIADSKSVAGIMARRATTFIDPPRIWQAVGRKLVEAVPAAIPVPVEPPFVARQLIGMLVDAGVEVTVEHGEIRGELRGLEVSRIVVDDGVARIEVGVGRHDREAFTMVHGNLPTPDALASVVQSVAVHRRFDAEPHPLRQLAPEAWLRSRMIAEPSFVGAAELRSVEPPIRRESVKDTLAAMAFGVDPDGRPVMVACSVGIDLDVVPSAADARLGLDPEARLVIVLPERDNHPATRKLAASLVHPAEIISVAGDWRVFPGDVTQ